MSVLIGILAALIFIILVTFVSPVLGWTFWWLCMVFIFGGSAIRVWKRSR
jgi:hypothetical protein